MSVALNRIVLVLLLVAAGLLGVVTATSRPSAAVAAEARTWVVDAIDDPRGNRWESVDTGTNEVTIGVGDTVEWQFDRAVTDHDLTSQNTTTVWQPALEQWRAADGAPVSYTFTQPGTYDYLCSIHGVVMQGKVVVVAAGTGNRPPTVAPMADVTNGPAPLTSHLMAMATDPDGDPLTYQWDLGNGSTSTEANPTASYSTPGSYTATVDVSDGHGGTAHGELLITVTGGEVPVVTVGAAPTGGAAPLDVVLTATAVDAQGGPLTYAWTFGDGTVGTGAQVAHTYTANGVRTATVKVTDSDGNVGTGTATITVGAEPGMPEVAASAAPASGAAPLGVAFSTAVTTSGSFAAFADGLTTYPGLTGAAGLTRTRGQTRAWFDVTGLRPGASHLVHVHEQACSASNGGAHFRFDTSQPFGEANEIWLPFTANPSGGSGRIEVVRPMRADASAVSMVIHDPDNPAKRIGCVDLMPSVADLTYTWSFGDGAVGEGPDPDHTYTSAGTYDASVTVAAAHAGHAGHGGADPAPVTTKVRVVVAAPPDRTAPQTTIASGPSGVVGSRRATFRLASNEQGVSFSCRLDGGGWRACTSPVGYQKLGDGFHLLEVRARDRAGNTDPTPAMRSWTVDTRRPVLGSLRPRGTVHDRTPTVRLRARDAHLLPGATGFTVRIDGRRVPSAQLRVVRGSLTWTPRRALSVGRHTLRVSVVDAAGNRSTALRTFKITR
jgi:PKD repeat protein